MTEKDKQRYKKDFSGYLTYKEQDCFCSIQNYLVKVFPKNKDAFNKAIKNTEKYFASPEYVFGVDEINYPFAVYKSTPIHRIYAPNGCGYFSTPIVIKSVSNTNYYGDGFDFDAITFSAGCINSIYDIDFAIDKNHKWSEDGSNIIKVKKFSEYTKEYDIEILGQKTKFLYSIGQNYANAENSLGEINSQIMLEFDETQTIDKFLEYYHIIKDFLSFLMRARNITFDVSLSRKIGSKYNELDGKYVRFAICYINDGYENYCGKNKVCCIQIDWLGNKVRKAIEIFANKVKRPFIEFLPKDNKKSRYITHNDIEDLCTALQTECKKNKPTDEVKNLRQALKDLIETKLKDNLISQKIYEISQGTVSNLGYPLAEQICSKFDDCYVDASMTDEQRTSVKQMIIRFVQIRNDTTHNGITNFSFEVDVPTVMGLAKDTRSVKDIYPILDDLLYILVLMRCGFTKEEASKIILKDLLK